MPMTLTISVSDAGAITVSGPIGNAIMAYGILELGRQAIQKHLDAQQNRVQLAGPGALPPAGNT